MQVLAETAPEGVHKITSWRNLYQGQGDKKLAR